jgi:ABC-2 type transport system permease protein
MIDARRNVEALPELRVPRRRARGGNPLVRSLSFFAKEVNEVRRQIRLVLALVLGPFLILLLFGIGYQSDRPHLTSALVIPEGSYSPEQEQQITEAVGVNFPVAYAGPDEARARAMLASGQVDLVEILPPNVAEQVEQGAQAEVQFVYNAISPIDEQWIQYLSYAQVIEINRAVLIDAAKGGQAEAAELQSFLGEARAELETLRGSLGSAQQATTRQRLSDLAQTAGVLAASPLLAAQARTSADAREARDQLVELQGDLAALDEALDEGRLAQQEARLDSSITRIGTIEERVTTLRAIPAEVLVSPLIGTHRNEAGIQLDYMTFYAPSVIALILQHIAVTLGALALVRERLQGSLELFRVAPVSATQLLVGKYVGFTLFIALIALALAGLMWALGVPFLGSPWSLALVLLLLVLASLGLGFLISAISTSDSQAVQLSMLVLLMAVFFSGFFLPLENFWAPVRAVGYALPLTHGIVGLQDVMLRGWAPDLVTLSWLGGAALLLFLVVNFLLRREFRRG